MRSNIRQFVQIVLVFIVGWILGHVFKTSTGDLNCTDRSPFVIEKEKLVYHRDTNFTLSEQKATQSMDKDFLLETPGIIYDCLTGEVVSTYDPERIKKDYQIFPEVKDGAEGDGQRQKAFETIYNKQLWGEHGEEEIDQSANSYKASGPGSSLEAAQGVMGVLHTVITKLKLQLKKPRIKLLDLPCGDLQWMSHFLKSRSDIDYTGMDIVPALIVKHNKTYIDNPNIHFQHFDIVKNEIGDSYDLVICRMMLQHLLNMDVLKALYHFSSSKSLYFAATTFPYVEKNDELVPIHGRARFLNLEKPPVNLSPPLCTFQEPLFPDHHLSIWKVPLLQHI